VWSFLKMNDQIKFLVAGAAIGIAGAAVGGMIVAWALMKEESGRTIVESGAQRVAVSGRPSAFGAQRPVNFSPSVFPVGGTNVRLGPIRGTNVHLLTSVATNGGKRLVTSAPTGGMSLSAIQQVQNVPEVKKAREEAAEAQRRYFEAMKKVVESGPRPGIIPLSTQ